MKKIIVLILITLLFSTFFNLLSVNAAKSVVVRQTGLPGSENIDMTQIQQNLEDLKGTPAGELADGLNRVVIIVRQLCPDGTSQVDFIHMILEFYGYWDDFLKYVELLGKIQQGIQLTEEEAKEFLRITQLFEGLTAPNSESGTDMMSTLNKYDGQAGQLGGFCNVDISVGTCLYDSREIISSSGVYYPENFDGNNQPTKFIQANGRSTYDYCKVMLCGDPSMNVECVNGCTIGLVCCATSAGPDIGRYFQGAVENGQQVTMVFEKFPYSQAIGVLSPVSSQPSNAMPITDENACKLNNLPVGYFSACMNDPLKNGGTSCMDYNCPGFSWKQMYVAGNPGGCSQGKCWVYGTPVDEGGSATSPGAQEQKANDGGQCTLNADGTVTHSCSGGDIDCYDTQCCGYNPKTDAGKADCTCHCGTATATISAGNKCTCTFVDPEPSKTECDFGYKNVNGVCAPIEGCAYGRPSCTGCDTCKTDTVPDGVCVSACTGDTPVCDVNNQCVAQSGGGGGLCPSVFSVDSEAEKWEEESILGQFNKGIETPFYNKLNYLGDSLNVRIKEMIPFEVTYLNQVSLIELDSSNALLDVQGEPHSINVEKSVKCIDSTGSDCTTLISKADSKLENRYFEWREDFSASGYNKETYVSDIGSLKNKFGEIPLDDYLELDLDNINSDTVKLILVADSTDNLENSEKAMAEIAKGDPKLFYTILDSPLSPLINDKVDNLASLKILYLDENENWIELKGYSSVYTSKRKQVVPVPAKLIRNGKLRLEFTTGFYAIDYVAYDDTPDSDIKVTEHPLISAIRSDGSDEFNNLLTLDSDRLSLATGEFVDMVFDGNKDENSVYYLKVIGYYHPGENLPSDDNLDYGLIANLIFKKGYAKEYMVEKLFG